MQPLTGECEWYRLCSNGNYTARRCPTDRKGQRQMFNPTTNSCTDKLKMTVDGKCQSYKICLFIESVSMNGRWTELSCGPGQHFDQESQKCIEEETSTCGVNICKVLFFKLFSKLFFF
jgi:hypothetical protein